jgi:ubiquinone/menaquinone biosynthesis C-methylase UbiE
MSNMFSDTLAEEEESSAEGEIFHPRFAAFYTWLTQRPQVRRQEEPLRRELVGQAHGLVLEVGAGGGQNFPFYDATRVVRVEATEPDAAMLAIARQRLASAPVPITLRHTPVENLPFPDGQFDSVVVTLVFCSVGDPDRGLREIRRVMKPGGTLLMLEHVRGQGKLLARIQDALVPVTTRLTGNCHWNRDTQQAIVAAGFRIMEARHVRGGPLPAVLLRATRAPTSETESWQGRNAEALSASR